MTPLTAGKVMAEDHSDTRSWLIGGPSRNGKTTLVAALQNTDSAVAGLPVEGLFPVYLARTYLFPASQCHRILREYLTRPHYTDAARSQTARPIDYYSTPIEDVLGDAATANRHQIGMIVWAFDVFARLVEFVARSRPVE